MTPNVEALDHSVATLAAVVGDAETDPVAVYQAIADEALASFSASSTGIWFPPEGQLEPTTLRAIVVAGDVSPDIFRLDIPIEGTILGQVFTDRKPFVVGDFRAPDTPAVSSTITQVFNFRSAIVLPIRAGGLLTIVSDKPDNFSAAEVALAESFAALTSAACALSDRAAQVERARLMSELHDGAIQVLYGAMIEAELGLEAECLDDSKVHMSAMTDLVREGLRELRESVLAMDAARKSLFSRIRRAAMLLGNRTFIAVEFEGEDLGPEHPWTEDLGRIQLEATSNAIRHGKASNVTIKVLNNQDRLTMEVIDDGVGFDPTVKRAGLGLANMPRRADRIGGKFEVNSAIGAGATVTVTVNKSAAHRESVA